MMFCPVMLTAASFLIGMCLYIGEMVNDMNFTQIEIDREQKMATKRLIREILFYNDVLV